MIFSNPNKLDMENLFKILYHFGEATGLELNISRCSKAPIRCAGLDLDDMLESFQGQIVQFPLTFLGLVLALTFKRTKQSPTI